MMKSKFSKKYRDLFVLKHFKLLEEEIIKDRKTSDLTEVDKAVLDLVEIIKPIYLKSVVDKDIFFKIEYLNNYFKINKEEFGLTLSSVLLSYMFQFIEEYKNAFDAVNFLKNYDFKDSLNKGLIMVRLGELMFDKLYNRPHEEGERFFKLALDIMKQNEKYYVYALSFYLHYNGVFHLYKAIETYAEEFSKITTTKKKYQKYKNVIFELEYFKALENREYLVADKKFAQITRYFCAENRLLEAYNIYLLQFKYLKERQNFKLLKREAESLYKIGYTFLSSKIKMKGLEEKVYAEIALKKDEETLQDFKLYLMENGDYIAKKRYANIIHSENQYFLDLFKTEIKEDTAKKQIIEQKNALITKVFNELRDTQKYFLEFDKFKKLGEVSASVCHDLNTPIGAIQSSTNTLNIYLKEMYNIENIKTSELLSVEERKFFYDSIIYYDFSKENKNIDFKEKKRREEIYLEIFKDHPHRTKITSILMEINDVELIDDLLDKFGDSITLEKINLLNTIIGIQRKISTINIASENLTSALKNIKKFARFEEKTFDRLDLIETIEKSVTMLKNGLSPKVKICTNYLCKPNIIGNKEDLCNLWNNLLQNAVYAVKDEGIISIRTYYFNDRVYIEFENNGEEIPKSVLNRMFQVFFTTKPEGIGSGLGLNICKKICIEHKANINVHSDTNKTVFTLDFPFLKDYQLV